MSVGRIYWAWVDPGTTYDPVAHSVEDEAVFSLRISQAEGEFAVAEAEIVNPGVGLLATSRKRDVLISAEIDGNPTLLFRGRVTGAPIGLAAETLTVQLTARPADADAFSESFRNAWLADHPTRWHPLLVAPDRRNELDEVLEEIPALPHWPRAKADVSRDPEDEDLFPHEWGAGVVMSDILQGRQVLDLGAAHFHDSITVTLTEDPVTEVAVNLSVEWQESAVGWFSAARMLSSEFGFPTGNFISTLTPQSIESAFGSLQGSATTTGVQLLEAELKLIDVDDRAMRTDTSLRPTGDAAIDAVSPPVQYDVTYPEHTYEVRLRYEARYQQARREKVSLLVRSALQGVATSKRETLDLRMEDLSSATITTEDLGEDEPVPSPGRRRRSILLATDDTGAWTRWSDDYGVPYVGAALRRAAARLTAAARCVEVSATWPLSTPGIVGIDCDTSIRLEDDRLPGGFVVGKVKSYELAIDGSTGVATVQAALGVCVGRGTPAEQPADPPISINVATPHITAYASAFGDATVTPMLSVAPPDTWDGGPQSYFSSGLIGSAGYMITSLNVTNPGIVQRAGNYDGGQDPEDYLQQNPTAITIEFRQVPQSDVLDYSSVVMGFSPEITLALPAGINLGEL